MDGKDGFQFSSSDGNRGEAPRRGPMATKANTSDLRSSASAKNSGESSEWRCQGGEATQCDPTTMNSSPVFVLSSLLYKFGGKSNLTAERLWRSRVESSNSNRNLGNPSRNPLSGGVNDTALRWLFYLADSLLLSSRVYELR
nr:hypothetical protein Itr_chr06CG08970 [Ipomoea trifida]